MFNALTAAAREGLEDGLGGLERLKRNLQNAAALCQPTGAASAVYDNEREARCTATQPVDFAVCVRHALSAAVCACWACPACLL